MKAHSARKKIAKKVFDGIKSGFKNIEF